MAKQPVIRGWGQRAGGTRLVKAPAIRQRVGMVMGWGGSGDQWWGNGGQYHPLPSSRGWRWLTPSSPEVTSSLLPPAEVARLPPTSCLPPMEATPLPPASMGALWFLPAPMEEAAWLPPAPAVSGGQTTARDFAQWVTSFI